MNVMELFALARRVYLRRSFPLLCERLGVRLSFYLFKPTCVGWKLYFVAMCTWCQPLFTIQSNNTKIAVSRYSMKKEKCVLTNRQSMYIVCVALFTHTNMYYLIIIKCFGCYAAALISVQNRTDKPIYTKQHIKLQLFNNSNNWAGTWCARASIAWRVCATSRSYMGGSMLRSRFRGWG